MRQTPQKHQHRKPLDRTLLLRAQIPFCTMPNIRTSICATRKLPLVACLQKTMSRSSSPKPQRMQCVLDATFEVKWKINLLSLEHSRWPSHTLPSRPKSRISSHNAVGSTVTTHLDVTTIPRNNDFKQFNFSQIQGYETVGSDG